MGSFFDPCAGANGARCPYTYATRLRTGVQVITSAPPGPARGPERCLGRPRVLHRGFFSHAAVLGEGTTDGALLEGCAERNGVNLGAEGITFVDVTGRDNLLLSHAICSAMGIPCHVIFDGDAGLEERKRGSVRHLNRENRRERKEAAFEQQARKISGSNADLLGYLRESRSPWPATGSASVYTVCEDNLETNLGEAWPSWESGNSSSSTRARAFRTRM
ncbi:TOPRIM nucleotidyl transferase/hydrolase domain-containing protein [Streptomyces sp. NPDC059918]|uniref:TOPRIM nucleotidyl transferase/hydrolase domain-containing protein n=1 Tax=unclassified Streptomyces TaxID=2593676 RepID=UPI00364D9A34